MDDKQSRAHNGVLACPRNILSVGKKTNNGETTPRRGLSTRNIDKYGSYYRAGQRASQW